MAYYAGEGCLERAGAAAPSRGERVARVVAHVRVLTLLSVLQGLIWCAAVALCLGGVGFEGFGAMQVVALAARTSKRTTQALGHCLALACCEWPPQLVRLCSSANNNNNARPSSATELRRRRQAFAVASYYVEMGMDVLEQGAVVLLYVAGVLLGGLKLSAGSVLISVYAQQTHAQLRAKLRQHAEWRRVRKALDTRTLFRVAAQEDVTRHDDICCICHDTFALVSGGGRGGGDDDDQNDATQRTLGKDTPVALPRCAHLLHKGCLQLYLDNTLMRTRRVSRHESSPVV